MDLPRSRSSFWALRKSWRLVADRIGELERTRQPAHFAQSVGEIPFRFRAPATTGLLTAHPRESPSLLPRDLIPLRVGAATDFRRQAAIVASRSKWRTRSLALLVVVRPPLRPVIDALFIDDQATVFADRFDRVRRDSAVALGTLVRARVRSDVFVEASFVDVSGGHRSHRVQGTHHSARPSLIEGTINAIEYGYGFSRIGAQMSVLELL